MCGIVGYIGERQAQQVLLHGLEKLEYRGYDSAGIAVFDGQTIRVKKKLGRLANLENMLNGHGLPGVLGIGHTRWATHGRPSDANAHPHGDCTGRFVVVHNGIIENYLRLRQELQQAGHKFRSETDTEVVAHLVESLYDGDLLRTVFKAAAKLRGAYALVVMSAEEPGRLVAVRKHSPLVVGLGDGENFVASDIPALLNYTRDVYVLEEGEVADITAKAVRCYRLDGTPVSKEVLKVTWDVDAAEKGGYEHFMLKEIYEQPKAVADTLTGRLSDDNRAVLPELDWALGMARGIDRIHVVACGTAYHAGMVGRQILERLTRIPVEVEVASEYRYRDPIYTDHTLVLVISQSGETADTLAALQEAKARGARVVAVTNVVGSSVAREADDVIITWAGPEIAVASTKAYTTQLVALYLFACYLAQLRGAADPATIEEVLAGLRDLPDAVSKVLDTAPAMKAFAQQFARKESAFFIGRGLDYVAALEGALKLKEISYIHAEAYAAGELKHGTLALIAEGVPVIALATQDHLYEKTVSNIKEVKARDAHVLALTWTGDEEMASVADEVLYLPRVSPWLAPAVVAVPLQLLAYFAAVERGNDVDKPRNLAKSVTVE
ncbi:glutamine--fructose-6-phosphate transaminase (isomerizing) [Kyrpidia spormannii]|uniref:L-glutamine-D-fructose-6-phosphate amidotransferase n=1 Tax=Kyrpidia spormannii TaxID=2055160 RepID=A0ACA8Z6B5_9BACL|nr:glutamine--fructose-6-phosphate transaminase (isomerizing) [Kyrpidia spormannii]CAB3389379.1 L-glutamine-D-fructose-6-phosphate amidotransferase [Kyrpidia spormannii]